MSEENTQEINNLADVAGGHEATQPNIIPPDTNQVDPLNVPVEGAQENGWFLTDGVAGEGEAPEWLNTQKYKNVSEQAKGYNELQKMFGAFTGAPETYSDDLGLDYEGIEFDPEDPLLSNFKAFAKDANMSQEKYQGVLKMFVDYSNSQHEGQENSVKEQALAEMEKIGNNPNQQINEMVQWFGQNFPNVDINKFKNTIRTAGDFEILKTLRQNMGYQRISQADNVPLVDPTEARKLLNSPEYLSDKHVRAKVDRMYSIMEKQGIK